MKAMILAAGLGTRLQPLTSTISKPMVQLVGRPCMEYTVRLLKKYGVEDIMVNLHYYPEIIKNYFKDGSAFGLNINYSYEKELLGTAGGLKKVEDFFAGDTVLIISGDGLTDINIRNFYEFHKDKGCIATLALKEVGNPELYGVVKLNNSIIDVFQEKPKKEEAISNLANTGIYMFEPQVFDYIPADSFYDFGRQLFPEFVEKKIDMAGYSMEGYWCDIGDLEVYKEAHYDILMGMVNVEVPGKKLSENIWIGSEVSIDPQTKIVGPVMIGDHCKIQKGAEIYGPVVLGENTIVEENAFIKRSILWKNVCVKKGATLKDTIVSHNAIINEGQHLDGQVVE